MSSPWFWILLTLSLIGTALSWRRVIKSEDLVVFKVAFFLFLDMPPRIPEEAQAKRECRTGTTLYTDIFAGTRSRLLQRGTTRTLGTM